MISTSLPLATTIGDYGLDVAQLREWHRPRLQTLAAAAPDAIAVETIPDIFRTLGNVTMDVAVTDAVDDKRNAVEKA